MFSNHNIWVLAGLDRKNQEVSTCQILEEWNMEKDHTKDKNGRKCGGFQLTAIHINFHKYQPIWVIYSVLD
jgi:hypothetical protein